MNVRLLGLAMAIEAWHFLWRLRHRCCSRVCEELTTKQHEGR